MKSRFRVVLTLMTACLVLCAGSQAALCELACGLGRNVQCHGSASPQATSNGAGMDGMEHMHCSGMTKSSAHDGDDVIAQMEGRDGGKCTHSSPVAVADSAFSNDSLALIQWVLVESVVLQNADSFHRFGVSFKSPPLHSPVDPLLVTLRV